MSGEASDCRVPKVFLVEDAPLLRERLSALIRSVAGLELVGHADSAQQAVLDIFRLLPDVVVLDLHLKEGHGFYVMRAVQERAPAVAMYVVTNFVSETYRDRAARYGARGFFDKSSEFGLLRDALAAHAK
jgi:DNA-binding NarL/FixJ family response regulator